MVIYFRCNTNHIISDAATSLDKHRNRINSPKPVEFETGTNLSNGLAEKLTLGKTLFNDISTAEIIYSVDNTSSVNFLLN